MKSWRPHFSEVPKNDKLTSSLSKNSNEKEEEKEEEEEEVEQI